MGPKVVDPLAVAAEGLKTGNPVRGGHSGHPKKLRKAEGVAAACWTPPPASFTDHLNLTVHGAHHAAHLMGGWPPSRVTPLDHEKRKGQS
ncbi:hypothetical protein ACP70R_041133 [Stipagrostis hirtigluma subsp. patula]